MHGGVAHPFFSPHESMQPLHMNCQAVWETSITGGDGAAQAFWDNTKKTPFVKNHPTLQSSAFHRTNPVGIHGDGGAFSGSESLVVLTWNSVLGSGSRKDERFPITIVRKSGLVLGTMEAILKV